MKIGILTFHRTINYGAVLQCYALQELLRRRGHQVEVIDYRIRIVERERRFLSFSTLRTRKSVLIMIKYIIKCILIYRKKKKAINAIDSYLERRILLSKRVNSIKDIPSYYDCIIFGSDQIWNPNLCDGFDSVFWGQFPKGKTKFIAYAASIGEVDVIEDDQWVKINELIRSFDMISVREKELEIALKSKFCIPVQCCLDPTLMIDSGCFDSIAVRPKETNYVFLYNVQKDSYSYIFAKRLAEKLNCKVIRGQARPEKRNKKDIGCQLVECISPEEFLGYIKYSQYVVGNSFHAIALSLVFRKNFYSLECPRPSRVKSLLKQVGLLERHLSSQVENISIVGIDYSEFDSRIKNLRKDSMLFIEGFNA